MSFKMREQKVKLKQIKKAHRTLKQIQESDLDISTMRREKPTEQEDDDDVGERKILEKRNANKIHINA